MPAPNKTALILLADGLEEIEFVVTVDVLRRAEFDVTIAGLAGRDLVKCCQGVMIKPDTSLKEVMQAEDMHYDVVVLPGGPGAKSFVESEDVRKLLKEQEESQRYIAAICGAPALIFPAFKIGENRMVTSDPHMKEKLASLPVYKYMESKAVVDGNIITSRGPGTAFDFALAIVGEMCGCDHAVAIRDKLIFA